MYMRANDFETKCPHQTKNGTRRRERWGGAPKDDEMMLSYDEIMKKCS
jgi:hypothetical protein